MFKHRNRRLTGICSMILSLVLVMSLTIPMVGHAEATAGSKDDKTSIKITGSYITNIGPYGFTEYFASGSAENDIKTALVAKYAPFSLDNATLTTFDLTDKTSTDTEGYSACYEASPIYNENICKFQYQYYYFRMEGTKDFLHYEYETLERHAKVVDKSTMTAEELESMGKTLGPNPSYFTISDYTLFCKTDTSNLSAVFKNDPLELGYDFDLFFLINDGSNDDGGNELTEHENDKDSIDIVHIKGKSGETYTFPTTSTNYANIKMTDKGLATRQTEYKNSTVTKSSITVGEYNTCRSIYITLLGTPKSAIPNKDDDSTPDINEATNPTEAEINNRNTATTDVVQATSGEDGGIIFNQATIAQNVEKIQEAVAESSSTEKKSVTINMAAEGANLAPATLLEAAKGKNVDLVFDMGTYTWTVNGNDITAANLKNINLKVHTDTDNIPNDTVKQLAGDLPTQQLSLNHDGDFGFTATLTIKAPEGQNGTFGNLFWYDNGELKFIDAGQVAADGFFSLKFTHASDYAVIFGADMTPVKSPKTGDNYPNWGLYVSLLTAGGFLFLLGFKKEILK